MDGYRELELLLLALRTGAVDPARLAEVGADWSPAAHHRFLDFLTDRGVLARDQRNRLESTVTAPPAPLSSADGTTLLRPPPRSGTETPILPPPGGSDADTPLLAWSGDPVPAGRVNLPTDRYRPIRLHRTGGLGQVWLARDTVVDREVALKVVRPDRAGDPGVEARFVREARATGRLEHPGIVPLYDLIDAAGGRGPAYVMRFVAGRTLSEAAAAYHRRRAAGMAGPLELAALLDAFVAVCRAVAFAHDRGVLHRDLKGQNVVLGDFGEVFLLDWGLAKRADGTDGPATPVPVGRPADDTLPGAVVGTPAFMAPEVAAGGPATKASDVYGLGAVLYAVLTGRPPLDGPTPAEVLRLVVETDPDRPRAVNPTVPPALEAVCRKAMARDPAGRYATADDLATDVRRWLADEPVTAYRDPPSVRAGRWARRHRTAVAAAGVFLATAVVALGVSTALVWQEKERTAAEERRARNEWARAEGERERAEQNLRSVHLLSVGLTDFTESVLPTARNSELARRRLTDAAADAFCPFADQRPDDSEVQLWAAQLRRLQGNVRRLLDDVGPADTAYRESIRLLRAEAARRPHDPMTQNRLAETLRDHAALLAKTGRLTGATDALAEAAALAAKLRDDNPGQPLFQRTAATVALDRSAVEHERGLTAESEKSAGAAVEEFRSLATVPQAGRHPYDPLLLAAALVQQAVAARDLRGYEVALAGIREARAILKAAVDRGAPGSNLDDYLFFQAQCELEASRTWARNPKPDWQQRADDNLGLILIRWDDLAKRHPNVPFYRAYWAVTLLTRGEVRAGRGQTDAAGKDFEAARTILEKLTADHPGVPEYRADLGRTYLGLGRTTADRTTAAEWYRKAVAALQAAAGQAPDSGRVRQSLADARAAAGG